MARPRSKPIEDDPATVLATEVFHARRSLTMGGKSFKPGDVIPDAVMALSPRPEALVRAGLVSKG